MWTTLILEKDRDATKVHASAQTVYLSHQLEQAQTLSIADISSQKA